jgi:hypothetical protein
MAFMEAVLVWRVKHHWMPLARIRSVVRQRKGTESLVSRLRPCISALDGLS